MPKIDVVRGGGRKIYKTDVNPNQTKVGKIEYRKV